MVFVSACIIFLLVVLIRRDPAVKRLADRSSRWFTGRYTKYIVIIVMSLTMIRSIVKLLHVLFSD